LRIDHAQISEKHVPQATSPTNGIRISEAALAVAPPYLSCRLSSRPQPIDVASGRTGGNAHRVDLVVYVYIMLRHISSGHLTDIDRNLDSQFVKQQ